MRNLLSRTRLSRKAMNRPLVAIIVGVGVCTLMVFVCLCVIYGRSQTGAATMDELIQKYRLAHQRKDIRALRKILWWETQLVFHRRDLEKPMREIFDMPLAEVKYVAGPPLEDEGGGIVSYYVPGPRRKGGSMIGPVCGKLLLVEAVEDDREPRILDPAYIVMKAEDYDNRYYIDILLLVADDAATAYKTNSKPKYVPVPLGEPVPR